MNALELAELRRIAKGCAASRVKAAVVSTPQERQRARKLEHAGLIELEGSEGNPHWLATMTAAGVAAAVERVKE